MTSYKTTWNDELGLQTDQREFVLPLGRVSSNQSSSRCREPGNKQRMEVVSKPSPSSPPSLLHLRPPVLNTVGFAFFFYIHSLGR